MRLPPKPTSLLKPAERVGLCSKKLIHREKKYRFFINWIFRCVGEFAEVLEAPEILEQVKKLFNNVRG